MDKNIIKVLHIIDEPLKLMWVIGQDGGMASYYKEDCGVSEYFDQRLHPHNLDVDDGEELRFDELGNVYFEDWETDPTPGQWLEYALAWLYMPAPKKYDIETVYTAHPSEVGLMRDWLAKHFKANPHAPYIPNHELPWKTRILTS